MSTALQRHKLSWKQLISVATDETPNLVDKNVGLVKRMQDTRCSTLEISSKIQFFGVLLTNRYSTEMPVETRAKDGSSKFLQSVVKLLPDYIV
jgi:hypothetical protein